MAVFGSGRGAHATNAGQPSVDGHLIRTTQVPCERQMEWNTMSQRQNMLENAKSWQTDRLQSFDAPQTKPKRVSFRTCVATSRARAAAAMAPLRGRRKKAVKGRGPF